MNFRDEAAYKAYLAKCQKERDASEDIAFRNHGEYIKYLTKIKEKEDDAHSAWAVTKAELDTFSSQVVTFVVTEGGYMGLNFDDISEDIATRVGLIGAGTAAVASEMASSVAEFGRVMTGQHTDAYGL